MSLLYCQTPVSVFGLGIGVGYLLSQKQGKQPHRNLPDRGGKGVHWILMQILTS